MWFFLRSVMLSIYFIVVMGDLWYSYRATIFTSSIKGVVRIIILLFQLVNMSKSGVCLNLESFQSIFSHTHWDHWPNWGTCTSY